MSGGASVNNIQAFAGLTPDSNCGVLGMFTLHTLVLNIAYIWILYAVYHYNMLWSHLDSNCDVTAMIRLDTLPNAPNDI